MNERRAACSVRLTLAAVLGDDLNGAWWPRSSSIADELAPLTNALRDTLGSVLQIQVNWSTCDGALDLDLMARHGATAAMPGLRSRSQRVMSISGSEARAKLIVVPSRTTAPLAVMVLRHAAGLPIDARHQASAAFRAADDIVRAARDQCAGFVPAPRS